jgi:hypothetical protein
LKLNFNKGRLPKKTKRKMKIKNLFKSRLKLEPGTRTTSFLFIATSIAIAAGILFAANMYYNIDTGEVVVEEIQRVSNVLRATAGLIVGGTATQNPSTGYVFEVVGQSKLATTTIATGPLTLSAANQELRFTGGTSYYVGFKATTTLSATSVYTWPASYPEGSGYVLTSDTSGNLSWVAAGTGGIGDVTAVGDCGSGDCFSNAPGAPTSTTLWFKTGSTLKALTIAGTANATYTLPDVSAGTYYFILASSGLTANQIPYMTGAYTVGGSQSLTFDATSRILTVGSANNTGQLRLYSNNANYVGFGATSSLASTVTYTWPAAPSGSGYVLSSDTSGNLSWVQAGDITAVGDCASGDCFTGTSGSTLWFKSGSYTGALTVAALSANATYTLPAVSAGTYYFALATTTFPAGYIAFWSSDGNVITGSDTLVISGNSVLYRNQYPLAASGKQVLREMVPIFGFDLPVKTATTSYVQISRTIVNYPLNPCESGATRVHKLVIRYGATATSTWQVATSSGGYAELTVPPTGATSTGSVYTIQTDIPTPSGSCTGWNQGTDTDDWWVRMRLNDTGEIMIYQIFLAGYDQLP